VVEAEAVAKRLTNSVLEVLVAVMVEQVAVAMVQAQLEAAAVALVHQETIMVALVAQVTAELLIGHKEIL
jgi:hypothetical protein